MKAFSPLVSKSEWGEIPLVMSQLSVSLQLGLTLCHFLYSEYKQGKAPLWECFTDDLQSAMIDDLQAANDRSKKRVLLYYAVNTHKLPTNIIC